MIIFFAKCVGSNQQTLRSRQFRSRHYLLVVWANNRIGWAMWFRYCPSANLSVLRPFCNGKYKITKWSSQRLCTIVDLETKYKEVKNEIFLWPIFSEREKVMTPWLPMMTCYCQAAGLSSVTHYDVITFMHVILFWLSQCMVCVSCSGPPGLIEFHPTDNDHSVTAKLCNFSVYCPQPFSILTKYVLPSSCFICFTV